MAGKGLFSRKKVGTILRSAHFAGLSVLNQFIEINNWGKMAGFFYGLSAAWVGDIDEDA